MDASSQSIDKSSVVRIGRVASSHGIKGEIKVLPLTDDPERFQLLDEVHLVGKAVNRSFSVKGIRFHQSHLLIQLEGIEDRDAADGLKNCDIVIDKAARLPLEANRFYIDDLIGLMVYEDAVCLGRLSEVLQPGANDVYVVQPDNGKTIYLPALKSVVRHVDLVAGRMDVVLPAGLVDVQ